MLARPYDPLQVEEQKSAVVAAIAGRDPETDVPESP
jgi:hypothetical protein